MVKWQDVKKLLIGSGIGIVLLFSSLFLLTGIDYTYTGDIVCGEECESYINITTSYWRICFDSYNGTKYEEETLFKKQTRSRTLHVNLDKIENIISTEPKVQVDWLVPTYGKNWRPLKGGDCWERGKINKIKLVGHKEEYQTVKWSFDLDDKVNIDPIWEGEENVVYTSSTDTICSNGKCNLILYSGIRNVYEDGTWKRVEDARSLKDKGFEIVYLENDPSFNIIVNDFNMSYLDMDLEFLGDPNDYPNYCAVAKDGTQANCDFKLDEKWNEYNETTGEIIEKSQLKFQYKWERSKTGIITKGDKYKYEYKNNPFGRSFKFGGSSTTIKLQAPNTENLEDAYVYGGGPTTTYGGEASLGIRNDGGGSVRVYTKFNLSKVPSGQVIEEAIVSLYLYVFGGTDTASVYHVYEQTWDDGTIHWNNQPCGTAFSDSGNCNLTSEDTETFPGVDRYNWNVTNAVSVDYADSETNVSFAFKTPEDSSLGQSWFRSKEHSTASERPYLNITYSEVLDTCTYSSGDWAVTCSDNCSISSNVNLGGNNLTLSNDKGHFIVSANISNFDKIIKYDLCEVRIYSGGFGG